MWTDGHFKVEMIVLVHLISTESGVFRSVPLPNADMLMLEECNYKVFMKLPVGKAFGCLRKKGIVARRDEWDSLRKAWSGQRALN